jgi:prepilin-type N-terminal cleavage/methylation domain-containing protein
VVLTVEPVVTTVLQIHDMQKFSISNFQNGYTLVEILVTLTIIALLFSFGYASFRDYSRRQALSNAVSMIQGDLRIAQGDAVTGQKPAGCSTTLAGYNFRVVATSPAEYIIEAVCGATTTTVKDVTMDPGITLNTPSPNPLLFKVLDQGTTAGAGASNWKLTFTQAGTNNTATVTVTSGGDIQ